MNSLHDKKQPSTDIDSSQGMVKRYMLFKLAHFNFKFVGGDNGVINASVPLATLQLR